MIVSYTLYGIAMIATPENSYQVNVVAAGAVIECMLHVFSFGVEVRVGA